MITMKKNGIATEGTPVGLAEIKTQKSEIEILKDAVIHLEQANVRQRGQIALLTSIVESCDGRVKELTIKTRKIAEMSGYDITKI